MALTIGYGVASSEYFIAFLIMLILTSSLMVFLTTLMIIFTVVPLAILYYVLISIPSIYLIYESIKKLVKFIKGKSQSKKFLTDNIVKSYLLS